jgi:hypothetical protein
MTFAGSLMKWPGTTSVNIRRCRSHRCGACLTGTWAIFPENVTQAQSDEAADLPTLDDRILKVVLAKNDLDFALYRYAVGRFVSRVTAHAVGLGPIRRDRSNIAVARFLDMPRRSASLPRPISGCAM